MIQLKPCLITDVIIFKRVYMHCSFLSFLLLIMVALGIDVILSYNRYLSQKLCALVSHGIFFSLMNIVQQLSDQPFLKRSVK